MSAPVASIAAAKARARALRTALAAAGQAVSHSQALELVARGQGMRDWNTLHAALSRRPLVLRAGLRVAGRYLGHGFEGRILSAEPRGAGWTRVTVHLDAAVDVAESTRFSAYRQRVTGTVGPEGRTEEETSAGVPHLEIDGPAEGPPPGD